GSAVLQARVVTNPAAGVAVEAAAWDTPIPPCARVLWYQILDADTGDAIAPEMIFPPHTVRRERWETRNGVTQLRLQLRNLGAAVRHARCRRSAGAETRRVRAVVHWFPQARGT